MSGGEQGGEDGGDPRIEDVGKWGCGGREGGGDVLLWWGLLVEEVGGGDWQEEGGLGSEVEAGECGCDVEVVVLVRDGWFGDAEGGVQMVQQGRLSLGL